MRADMQWSRGVLFAMSIAIGSSFAHADLLDRTLDATGGGAGTAGSGSAGSGSAGSGSAGSGGVPQEMSDLVAWAGESQPASLGQILEIAVKQAPALQNARIDVRIADAQIYETFARADWHVQVQLTGAKTISNFAGIALSSDQYGGTIDFTRTLPTGGTIDLHAGTTYSNTSPPPFPGLPTTVWQDTVNASITQPLLKGRGRWLYDAQERKARLSRDIAVLARRLAAIQTVENVVAAYWDLALAERQVAITQQSLDLARERLRVTQIGVSGGKTAQAEVPAVLQIIATRQEDVLNGELAVLDASIALRRAAGMPIGASALGLRVPTDLDARESEWPLAQLVERAYQASPELAELAKQNASAQIDIEVTSNNLLPQLDAMLQVGPVGQESAGATGSTETSTQAFSRAFKDMAELQQIAIQGSLTYSRSIQRRDVIGRVRELRTQKEKLAVNQYDLRANLAQTMSRAVAQIELARRRVQLSQQAIELAKQNIRIETDRFNLGTRTNFDVLNRLEDLRQAQLREAQALLDWHKADVVVQSLTGDLLPQLGISVDGAAGK
jgi:outer membrane protein TolC